MRYKDHKENPSRSIEERIMPTGLLFNKKNICAGFGEFKKKIMTVLLNEEKE